MKRLLAGLLAATVVLAGESFSLASEKFNLFTANSPRDFRLFHEQGSPSAVSPRKAARPLVRRPATTPPVVVSPMPPVFVQPYQVFPSFGGGFYGGGCSGGG